MSSPEPEEDARPARCVAVLAGGAGRRMGGSKATVELEGRPLVSYPVAAAQAAGLEALVVTRRDTALPKLDCEVLIEPDGPLHPAAGIVAALDHVGEPVVVLPCDAPFVPPDLLALLARRTASFAMPSHPRDQPLVARYTPSLRPRLRSAVSAGESMRQLAEALGGERLGADELAPFGDVEGFFANANDPGEVARLASRIRARRS